MWEDPNDFVTVDDNFVAPDLVIDDSVKEVSGRSPPQDFRRC